MTGTQYISAALRKLGVLDPRSTADASLLASGLLALNSMLARWSTRRWCVHTITEGSFSLTPGTAAYAIGSGGAFDTARPTRIVQAWVRNNDFDYPVDIVARENFAAIGDKTTSARPEKLWFEPTYPLATVTLWPVPDSALDTLYLKLWQPLSAVASVSDSLSLPPEYEEAIIWNLAVNLAPEFSMEPPQIVAFRADETLRELQRLHAQPTPQANTDFLHGRRKFNIFGDY